MTHEPSLKATTPCLAYLLWHLFDRARSVGPVDDNAVRLPVRQQHLADMLGLSPVHTGKTLQKIRDNGAIDIKDRFMHVYDEAKLIAMGHVEDSSAKSRPLI